MMAVENKQSFWNHLGSIVEIGIRNGDLRLSEKTLLPYLCNRESYKRFSSNNLTINN